MANQEKIASPQQMACTRVRGLAAVGVIMSEVERSIADAPSEHLIEIEFYSRRGNKDESLINGGGDPFDAKSR